MRKLRNAPAVLVTALATVVLIFGLALVVLGWQPFSLSDPQVNVGDTYTKTFTLQKPVAETDYQKGFMEEHLCTAYVGDFSGHVIMEMPDEDVPGSSYVKTVVWTPTSPGSFVVGALCARRNVTYNQATRSWGEWTELEEFVEDQVRVDVGLEAPPEPEEADLLPNILANLQAFICRYLHVFC